MTDHLNPQPTDHHLPTLFRRPDQVRDQLHVATVIYNSARYRTRWKHWQDFEKMCAESGALLYTLEVAFGARDFAITDPTNPRHFRMRTWDQMWFKENGINLLVSRMPQDAQWIAYVDADSRPVRPDWANETIHALQEFKVVQMWSEYQCLDSSFQLTTSSHSFMQSYQKGWPTIPPSESFGGTHYPYPYPYPRGGPKWPGPPGLAWAWRRNAWFGLLDVCILGSGDWYMANGLLGRLKVSSGPYSGGVIDPRFSKDYVAAILDWQEKAEVLRKDIGLVPGLWLHYWHGRMAKRGYATRNQILIDTQFSPVRHLKKDWQGLHSFSDRSPIELRDRIRAYLKARDEDEP